MDTIGKLKTNFKDDIINTAVSQKRRYNLIQNSDGTISLEDVTEYTQIGDNYGAEQINAANAAINQLIDRKRVEYADAAGEAEKAKSLTGDFVLVNNQVLEFSERICTISDARITADSLADVYFTEDTISTAEKSVISVETYLGSVVLSAGRTPAGTIKASIKIRVV